MLASDHFEHLKNTVVFLLSINSIVVILCSFFLMTRDLSFCLPQKKKILGIPNNILPSIFLVLIYSIIVLSLFLKGMKFNAVANSR